MSARSVIVRSVPSTLLAVLRSIGLFHPAISARDAVVRNLRRFGDSCRRTRVRRRLSPLAPDERVVVDVDRAGHRSAVLARLRPDPRASSAESSNRALVRDLLEGVGVLVEIDQPGIVLPQATPNDLEALLRNGPATMRWEWSGPDRSQLLVYEYSVDPSGHGLYGAEYATRVFIGSAPAVDTDDGAHRDIDAVYTWVDGSDECWQRRRHDVNDCSRANHPEADNEARYRSHDELLYSLRSLERFAEFVRHVYLVTDDQRPSWLVPQHPRLTVVDHREIFDDPTVLPTFNSHAIEARLHHIPGLSSRYLYLNDDFLFGRGVDADDFFDADGRARVFLSEALSPDPPVTDETKPVDAAAINVRLAVEREFNTRVPRNKFKHAPYAQLRPVMEQIEERFGPELRSTIAARVRSSTDLAVASSLHQHVALITNRGVSSTIDSEYVDLGLPHLQARLERLVRTPLPQVICLNDSDGTGPSWRRRQRLLRKFLESVVPGKSSFER